MPPPLSSQPSATTAAPSQCVLCRAWQRGGSWCGDCEARFAAPRPRCRRCALPLGVAADRCGACLAEPPVFDAAVAVVDYGFPWDGLLADFKFHGRVELGRALARRMAEAVALAEAQAAAAADGRPDLVLPVPSSRARLAERGFNQAWVLARPLASALGLRSDAGLLLRLADTPHQTALGRSARRANLARAFMVEPARRNELAGRHVALVDDVLTTGATLDAAAAELRRAGARRVTAWVFARTPAPGAD
jgi:ComF family protein